MANEWTKVESAAKNDAGEYMALVNGQWVPATSAAKNDAGEYIAVLAGEPSAPEEDSFLKTYVRNPLKEAIGGVVDPLMTMGMGAAGYVGGHIGGGVVGMAERASGATPEEAMASQKAAQQNIEQAFAYQPQTTVGKATTYPLEVIGSLMERGAEQVVSGIENPDLRQVAKENVLNLAPLGAAKVIGKYATKGARESKVYGKRDEIRAAGQESGLIAPPETGVVKKFLSTAGKGQDAVSVVNKQKATNMLARDVGFPEDTPITTDMIADRRAALNKSYSNVNKNLQSGVSVTDSFANKLRLQTSALQKQVAESPNLAADLKPVADIFVEMQDKIQSANIGGKQVRFALDGKTVTDTITALREKAGQAYASQNKQIGNYYKGLADDLELLVSNTLRKTGNFKAYNEFKNARTQHAKLHFLEEVLGEDRLVNFAALKGKTGKGKKRAYLTGETKAAAEFAKTFPQVTRDLSPAEIQRIGKWEFTVPFIAALTGSPAAATAASVPMGIGILTPPLAKRGLLQTAPNYNYTTPKATFGMLGGAPYIGGIEENQ